MDEDLVELLKEVRGSKDSIAAFNAIWAQAKKIDFDNTSPETVTRLIELGLRAAWQSIGQCSPSGQAPQPPRRSYLSDELREAIKKKAQQIIDEPSAVRCSDDSKMRISGIAFRGLFAERQADLT